MAVSKKTNNLNLTTNKLLFDAILDEYELRESQTYFLEEFEKGMKAGKKFFIVDAPVGSGKSLMAMLAKKWYKNNVNSKVKVDLITCTKNLQDQYKTDFPFLDNLKGKNNYRCEKHETTCDVGAKCNVANKEKCDFCPHADSIQRWLMSEMSLTNFHTHGVYSIYMPNLLETKKSDFLIVDEAHGFEETINGFVSFVISKKHWKKFVDATISAKWDDTVFSFENMDDIISWIRSDYIQTLKKVLTDLEVDLLKTFDVKAKEKLTSDISDISSLLSSLDYFLKSLKENSIKWVHELVSVKGDISWDFKPLWCNDLLKKIVWDKYKHVMMLSGTFLDIKTFCDINGVDESDVCYIKMEMTFPIEKRPIYYLPCGKMSYKEKDKSYKEIVSTLHKILDKYKNKKGIIFCNYETMAKIKIDFKKNKRFIYVEPNNREEAIAEHMNSKKDTVLVSASLYEGIDLKDDLSRFQVFTKIPYPSLASEVNKRRMNDKPDWYSLMTIMDIIQGYGRSIRSKEDHADTLILDSCFEDVMYRSGKHIPMYFKQAVKRVNK
jgi:ATP-dependent DNA helicase DinG